MQLEKGCLLPIQEDMSSIALERIQVFGKIKGLTDSNFIWNARSLIQVCLDVKINNDTGTYVSYRNISNIRKRDQVVRMYSVLQSDVKNVEEKMKINK